MSITALARSGTIVLSPGSRPAKSPLMFTTGSYARASAISRVERSFL
jgi:hypothetical protein